MDNDELQPQHPSVQRYQIQSRGAIFVTLRATFFNVLHDRQEDVNGFRIYTPPG